MRRIRLLLISLKIIPTLFIVFLFMGCANNKDYTPRPMGYNRIEKPSYSYSTNQQSSYSFEYADIARIKVDKDSTNWFNIVYPDYSAVIYCSYLPIIDRQTLGKALDDSYHLAYSHTVMADAINSEVYSDPDRHIGGMLYELKGNVATPIQFFVTDSISHFIRGSFYYNENFNIDSVSPITNFIKEDIIRIFNTIKFSDKR